jgi:hypothetical protein
MNSSNIPADDSACPAAFIAVPALLAALFWLYAMLGHLPQ